ncbi:MAG: long-chain-fatty-acid--CoA ligase [Hoeflea sp.]|uniref:long-chain-fatty-acid--CoA ligase n=1 Tax=Hoeflea sp. TaxID=1940281 RepID=UPI00329A3915
MRALIQEWPLLCHKIIDYAALQHGAREVVSRSVEGPIIRTSYADIRLRALQVRARLAAEGFERDDRIATLAWNTSRHVEAWYGIMGAGMICHTLNPRLFPEQLAWIMNDAQDRMVFVDLTFVPLMEKIAPLVAGLKRVVVLTDAAHMPQTSLPGAIAYEEWIAGAPAGSDWLPADENDAVALCYTSGTTGNPKGVLYSHRSNVLHAMMVTRPDAMEISSRDTVMPVVPMFHANAWGIAHAAPMAGARLVMPGGRMDGEAIWELLDSERVTLTAAVPTVWLMLLDYLRKTGKTLPWLKRVVIGGSASPRAMTMAFEKDYDVEVIHAWGMTEMSPVGSLTTIKPEYSALAGEALYDLKLKQGFAPFGVEMKLVDDSGQELAWDGKTFGRLKVRGMAVASSYYGGAGADSFDSQGWFETGDVAHIDPLGYMQITDRAKDVIKSGGEWISTIDLENLAVDHPDVAEAAVIGVSDPKWDERPLLIVVPRQGAEPDAGAILKFMEGKIAKWWIPERVAFVDEIPHTATGKINKIALREMFRDQQA